MSTVNRDELKAIKVLKFTGKESEWDHWSEKFAYINLQLSCEELPYDLVSLAKLKNSQMDAQEMHGRD